MSMSFHSVQEGPPPGFASIIDPASGLDLIILQVSGQLDITRHDDLLMPTQTDDSPWPEIRLNIDEPSLQ